MPFEQRLHPVSMLFALGSSIKHFAIPGLLVLFAGRSTTGGGDGSFGGLPANWEVRMMFLLVPLTLIAIARYLSFRIRYEDTELIIRTGILFRNQRHVPYTRIQNLEAVRNLFHRLFGVVEVRVENASGKDPEATISVLPVAAFDEMRRRVFEGRRHDAAAVEPAADGTAAGVALPSSEPLLRLSLRELLLCGFLENRGLVLIATIYGFLWELGPMSRLWGRLFDEGAYGTSMLREIGRTIASGRWPPPSRLAVIGGAIIGLLLFVRLISMLWAVIRLYGFTLSRAGDDLRTEFGLFTRVATTIPLRRVQTITIRESPLHRLAGRVSVRVETAGGSRTGPQGAGIEREWLAPLVRLDALPALLRHVVPGLDLAEVDWKPVHPRAFRRAIKPAMTFAGVVVGAVAALIGWRGWLAAPVVAAWFAFSTWRYIQRLGWAETRDLVAFRSGWLWRVMTLARVAKIQAVTLRETPFDRRTAMARVRVDTAGASAASHRVDIPYLPRDAAQELHGRLAGQAAATEFRW